MAGQQTIQDTNRRNMEVYVDDMLVKSFKIFDYIRDLEEAFDTLQ